MHFCFNFLYARITTNLERALQSLIAYKSVGLSVHRPITRGGHQCSANAFLSLLSTTNRGFLDKRKLIGCTDPNYFIQPSFACTSKIIVS